MPDPLKTACETFGVQLLQARAEVIAASYSVVPEHADSAAANNRVVVKADVGDQENGGPGVFPVTLTFTTRQHTGTATTLHQIIRAVEQANTVTPAASPAALSLFAFLSLGDEGTSEDTTGDTRGTVKTYLWKAKLA